MKNKTQVSVNTNTDVKIKKEKVYLSNDKNDMYQKQDINTFQNELISLGLRIYTGKNCNEKDVKLFIEYIEKNIKSTTSRNSFNIRVERLYNYIISKYSDYVEMIDFVRKGFSQNPNE